MSDDLLVLRLSWPVSTIDGEPSLTEGTLVVVSQPGGGFLLSVSSGDECFPEGNEVQLPLSEEHAGLVRRALAGERLGDVGGYT